MKGYHFRFPIIHVQLSNLPVLYKIGTLRKSLCILLEQFLNLLILSYEIKSELLKHLCKQNLARISQSSELDRSLHVLGQWCDRVNVIMTTKWSEVVYNHLSQQTDAIKSSFVPNQVPSQVPRSVGTPSLLTAQTIDN